MMRFSMMKDVMESMLVYHGGSEIITNPEIRIGKYTKDFYWEFYCTILPTQAERWAMRDINKSIVNVYKFSIKSDLNIKQLFRYPTHQINFHSARALECLTYERSYSL